MKGYSVFISRRFIYERSATIISHWRGVFFHMYQVHMFILVSQLKNMFFNCRQVRWLPGLHPGAGQRPGPIYWLCGQQQTVDYLIRLSSSGIPRSTGQQCRILYKKPNTESAEQTFVWLGKFKRILNSMNKKKHMFFLYCLVRERNIYTEWCYANGLKPKLPQAMKDKLMVSPTE